MGPAGSLAPPACEASFRPEAPQASARDRLQPDREPSEAHRRASGTRQRLGKRRGRSLMVLASVLVVLAGEAYGFLELVGSPVPSGFPVPYTAMEGPCPGRTVAVALAAAHAESFPVDATLAGVGSYKTYLTFDGIGQACDRYGDDVAERHEDVNVTARDRTHPFPATVHCFAALDIDVRSPSSTYDMAYSVPTRTVTSARGPRNAILLRTAGVEWPPQTATHPNVTISVTVFPDLYGLHKGDAIRFTVRVRFLADHSACFGGCRSPFYDEPFSDALIFEAHAVPS